MARPSAVVPARGCSSWSSRSLPARSRTGIRLFSKRPSFWASCVRSWLSAAKASSCSRVKPSSVAIRSAEMPCGTIGCCAARCGLSPSSPPPPEPIGTRDIDSMPPPITRSCCPAITPIAAKFTACWPEPQKRLSVTPLALSTGQPALSTALRAMSAPCSPKALTQPATTSSTSRTVEAIAIPQRVQALREQLLGMLARERADPGLAAAAGGSNRIDDPGFAHVLLSFLVEVSRGGRRDVRSADAPGRSRRGSGPARRARRHAA